MEAFSYEIVANTVIVVLALCGAVVMVNNTVKAVKDLHKPRADEAQLVIEHEEKLLNDYNAIQDLRHEQRIILECLMPILQHMIDGNDVEKLKDQKEKLAQYLYDKVEK